MAIIPGDEGDNDLAGDLSAVPEDDEISGLGGNDTMLGGGGNDTISGGDGTLDVAVFSGNWLDYAISSGAGTFTVDDTRGGSPDGTDTVDTTEFFTFANGTFSAALILNDAPVGSNDTNVLDDVTEAGGSANAVPGDPSASGNVLDNDTDPDTALGDTVAVQAVRTGSEAGGGGFTTVSGATQVTGIYGALTIHADGSYSYALNNSDVDTQALAGGATGTDLFTYRVVDLQGLQDLAQLSITVTGANDAPVITSNGGGASASISIAENGTAVTTVVASDVDTGTTLTYALAGGADAAKFAIDPDTGALTFMSAPDFETKADTGANNIYDVIVQVSDGTLTDSQTLAVTITNQNEAPTISSNGGGASASISVMENGTAVTTVVASDVDAGTTLTYSLAGGADAAKFTIDAETGVLTFLASPDFETKADIGANNIYDVIVQVSDGSLSDSQALAVTILNQNEAPVITSNGGGASASISMGENSTAVTTVAATDVDAGTTLTYTLSGGADAAKFTIDAETGALTFIAPPDFETKTDVGANNIYDVIVQVSDGTLTDTQALAVTITNQNDAPTISSNGGGATASISIAENGAAVTTVGANDVDPATTLTYALAGGADAAKFTIDSVTGALTFITAPDFETKADSGANNIYDVIVQVSDGGLTDTQALAVSVTNVAEAPNIVSNGGGATATVAVVENTRTVTTVVGEDFDAGSTLTYSLAGGVDSSKFIIDAVTGALTFRIAPNFEFPTDVGANSIFNVSVRVSDGTFNDVQSLAVTLTDANDAPSIQSNGGAAVAAVSIAENTTAVTTVTTRDEDAGAVIVYSIVGGSDAAKFTINSATGVLRFIAAPDFENKTDSGGNNVYDVSVQVSDGTVTDTQAIAVTVTNANEAPRITFNGGAAVANVSIAENRQPVATIGATDPDAGSTLTYSIQGGADAAKFTINAATGALRFIGAPDFETPTDAGGNNVYNVEVAISDGVLTDSQTIVVTVTNVPGRTIDGTAGNDRIDPTHTVAGGLLPTVEGDVLNGLGGNDTLDGGAGADTLKGGIGNDTYFVSDPGDVVTEAVGAGTDLVKASISYTLTANVENLLLTGAGGLTGTGNVKANLITGGTGDDTLIGLAGDDTLDGGGGADRMTGGGSNDTYRVNNAGDRTIELAGAGTDTVTSTVSFTLETNVENLILSGPAALAGTGNAQSNSITGTTKANTLGGGNGNDTLVGNAGNDTLTGGNNNDVLNGGTGIDLLSGGAGLDVFVFASKADSGPLAATRDVIADFAPGDHIDLSAIDADELTVGEQTLVLDTNASFSTGEIGLQVSGSDLIVRLNLDGDAAAEFTLLVQNVTSLGIGDFTL